MPIDPSIIARLQPLQLPSPLEIYSTVQQIAGQREAVEARRLAAEEARERRAEKQAEREQKAALDRALQAAIIIDPKSGRITFDRQRLVEHAPAEVAFAFQGELDKAEVTANQLRSTLLKLEGDKQLHLGKIGRAIRTAQYHPATFRPLMQGAHGFGALGDDLATQYEALEDPAAIQAVVDPWIALTEDEAKLEKVETVDAQGRPVVKFVQPTVGAEYPAAAKPSEHSPIYKEWQDYKLTGGTLDFDAYMTQDANRRRSVTTINTPRPITQTAEAGLITRLNTQWTKAAKPSRELSQQVATMRLGLAAAEKGDLAQGTEAVLQPFLKILDPTSVVREGEFFRLREGQSYIARAQGIMQRLTQGGFVPLSELQKYAALAEEIAKRQDSYVAAERGRIGKVAERYNIPSELVFETEAPAAAEDGPSGGGAPSTGGLTYQDYLRSRGKK